MREIHIKEEIIGHAIVDAINTYMREVLVPRCPPLEEVWDGPDEKELDRLKYEIAAVFAAKWAVSQVANTAMSDREPDSGSPALTERWAVWRMDEHDNTILVQEHLNHVEAMRLVSELTVRGDKPLYWAERETGNS